MNNHFVKVFLTDARGFWTFGLNKPFNFKVNLPRFGVYTNHLIVFDIAILAIIKTFCAPVAC